MSARPYKIVLHALALDEIRALPKPVRKNVEGILDSLAADPFPPGTAKLMGRENAYRIRVGAYRILYEVHATEIVVYVFGVAHRKEVYLRLLRRR